jgi:hypothetical protein
MTRINFAFRLYMDGQDKDMCFAEGKYCYKARGINWKNVYDRFGKNPSL